MATNNKTAPAKENTAVPAASGPAAKKPAAKKTAPARKDSSAMVTVCFRDRGDKIFEVNGRNILIKGHNSHLRGLDGGILDSGKAFGKTVIPRADWEAIKAKYANDPNENMFKGGFIFAHEDPADAQAEAKEKADLKTGFEPVNSAETASKEDKSR